MLQGGGGWARIGAWAVEGAGGVGLVGCQGERARESARLSSTPRIGYYYDPARLGKAAMLSTQAILIRQAFSGVFRCI